MSTQNLLLDGFGRIKEVVHHAVEGLDEAVLTFRPEDKANSIAWLIWHLTRIQDDHLADLRKEKQVWIVGSWYNKFNLPFDESDTGYGHTGSDVAHVQASAQQLIAYHDAVYAETIKFIKTLKEEDYDRIIDKSWDPPVTMAIRLMSVISDDLQHAGQAAYVRGLIQ
jgi:uncharacterized damage-inducible protein DinB